ncbi:MAG: SMI1/KNR4 family protein [Helicobacteraceae bacterium]|jgi:hypothetical protein|nr:SMI1/KNR4 family protein [Helicobacteraceae bacterium]
MNLVFENSSQSLDEADFEYLSKIIGRNLPKDLKDIYSSLNGGEIENERVVFLSQLNDSECGLDKFLHIRYKRYDDDSTIEDSYLFYAKKGFIPVDFLPFAIDGGGFPFCYDLNTGNIVFCNIEHFSPDFSYIEIISNSLSEVISNLMTRDEAYGDE